MAELSSYWRKGRRAWEKYLIYLRPSHVLFVVCWSDLKSFVFLRLKQQQVERSKASGILPLPLLVLINCLQSPSVLALYGKVQWVSFPFSFIHHSSQLEIVEGQLPGLPLTETLQIV